MELRDYQTDAVAAVYDFLRTKTTNPCVVLPTAAGKSGIMSQICRDAVVKWNGRVLILAHVKELLEQTAATIRRIDPDLPIGVYSAGLGSRDTDKSVIVAGIQSVYKKACEVDQLMNTTDNVDAACREIVSQTKERNSVLIFGVSVDHATRIKETLERFTSQECGLVIGDTPSGDRERILRRFKGQLAVASRMELSLRYDNPLPLVAGVDERNNVKRIIEREAKRDETARFPLKYLANVNVLTTGFDAPNVDCVVLLRPTASPGLYYQMVGRGFRLHETKNDCLILDYGGNILRHGPVDQLSKLDRSRLPLTSFGSPITPTTSERPGGYRDATPVRCCPKCLALVHAAVAVCPECGYEFPLPEKERHEGIASNEGILSGEVIDTEWDVEAAYYHVHTKKGGTESDPRTLRIDYRVGFNQYQSDQYQSEWVCPEHSGWARKKFEKWWTDRSNDPPPEDAAHAVKLAEAGSLSIPTSIIVRKVGGEKFDRIVKYTLPPEKPPAIADTVESESTTLCNTCVNSGYDDGFELACKSGCKPDGECSHFDGVTENNTDIDEEVPF